MFSLLSKIQDSLSKKDQIANGVRFTFVTDRQGVLKALQKSQQTGKLIGVYSRELGDGMFLTGVDTIENQGSMKIITFETYDMCGKILNRTKISLDEIKMVCPFDANYINPILESAPQETIRLAPAGK